MTAAWARVRITARSAALALLLASVVASAAIPIAVDGITEQVDGRSPAAWRALSVEEDDRFAFGHAVFNTGWAPALSPAGRRDGLGPLFNAPSCDACHNSRRRGRGPIGDGPAPFDLVVQVGRRLPDGSIERGHPRFGMIINTDAIEGFAAEASVEIEYHELHRQRADASNGSNGSNGSVQVLHAPRYRITTPDGLPLADDLILMPRMSPSAQGAGLLEAIPETAIVAAARARRGNPRGEPSWLTASTGTTRTLGRFGWQATEATVADQIASAFAREMGLTSDMIDAIDCAPSDRACREAANGGTPEVEAELFAAVLAFQQFEAVRRTPAAAQHLRASTAGARLFADTGCADCHRSGWTTRDGVRIDPYTDLLLHDLGPGLADRDAQDKPVRSRWRTAPLWGINTALEGGRTVRLLHDGRARSIDEAIGWHDGDAADSRKRFDALGIQQRQRLIDWVSAL